jgi:hypothetical protein
MSLLDLIVVFVVLVVNALHPLPWGVAIFLVGALIVERALKGERL